MVGQNELSQWRGYCNGMYLERSLCVARVLWKVSLSIPAPISYPEIPLLGGLGKYTLENTGVLHGLNTGLTSKRISKAMISKEG